MSSYNVYGVLHFVVVPLVAKVAAAAVGAVLGCLGLKKLRSKEFPVQPAPQSSAEPAPVAEPIPAPKGPDKPPPKPQLDFVPFVYPIVSRGFEFLGWLKEEAISWSKLLWEKTKEIAVNVATFTWSWTKRAAIAAAEAALDFCNRLLKPVREADAERMLEQALCIQSDVQNLEVAGVLQPFTKSPPRNKNQIPEALAA
jgi:hypothetical protein